ncbi:MAG: adhesin [Neisseria sp.]|nr:adhesin [Neisseria sp.]
MNENQQLPSVERFESLVKAKQYEDAANELLSILGQIDNNFGDIQNIECQIPVQLNANHQDQCVHFCTRMAVAITELFADPEFHISESGTLRFLSLQRWLNMIFASSPYINADHILATYNSNPEPNSLWNDFHLDPQSGTLYKFCVLYLPESNVALNLEKLWEMNPDLAASLAIALQSPRFIATTQAFNKRAAILKWAPERFKELTDITRIPSGILHDVYMHCSYDIDADKHRVKEGVNHLARTFLAQAGIQSLEMGEIGYRNGKPVMVVLLEHFHAAHSIYRTHSTSLRAAREHFHIIGIGNDAVDEAGRNVFDEFINLERGANLAAKLQQVRAICEENRAAVLYMPSIGMDLLPIFVSNLRLAPIQAIALGHPATTHSEFIDYVIVEDDYVGSEECFSEILLRLPKDALPYVPSALAPDSVEYRLIENPPVVHIGVAATTMKLNPYFLEACRAIRDRAAVKVHFHFALGQSSGVTHPYVERFIKSYLGRDASVYPHQDYQNYMRTLYQCDMMINPFPFGNTNGIIDMITLGLVGVCKTGPEVHEHIDEGLFKRLGLPEWLITRTADEYVACAVRLAENHEERLALRRHIIENNGLQTLFSGDPTPMGKVFTAKLQEWADKNSVKLDIAQPAKKRTTRRKAAATAETAAEEKPKKTAARKRSTAAKADADKPAAKSKTVKTKAAKDKTE